MTSCFRGGSRGRLTIGGLPQPHPWRVAVRELHACGFEHDTDLGQLFRGRRLPGIRSLGLADRVPSNAASTDCDLSAVPAEQLPRLLDLSAGDHRYLRPICSARSLGRAHIALSESSQRIGTAGLNWKPFQYVTERQGPSAPARPQWTPCRDWIIAGRPLSRWKRTS